MAEISGNSHGGGRPVTVIINEDDVNNCRVGNGDNTIKKQDSLLSVSVPFMQKLMAEVLGTYFLIFAGCAAVAVNAQKDKVISLTGISIVWGLAVMVLVYSVGHISGGHFNPAVTLAFASCRRFPIKQVPAYVIAQLLGSTMAAATLRLMFDIRRDVCSGKHDVFVGTLPSGSNLQSFCIEFIITFYLMFVISGVATDNRAIGELAGLAIGSTVLLNVILAGAVSGASMNPARTLGPAFVFGCYRGIWVYLGGTILGAISGAWVYNLVRFTDKPLREIAKSASFLKGSWSSRQ